MAEQYMTPEETDRYVDERIRRAMHPKRGIVGRVWGLIVGLIWLVLIGLVIAVFAFAARVQYGLPIPLPQSLVSTAAVTFSTAAAPLPTARRQEPGAAQQPAPALVPFYRPTVVEEQPTPTPEPTQAPAPTSFWTEEELKAFTATAEAFYQPETLPTAPPAFVQYVDERCRDAGAVEASATLQLFCGGGE